MLPTPSFLVSTHLTLPSFFPSFFFFVLSQVPPQASAVHPVQEDDGGAGGLEDDGGPGYEILADQRPFVKNQLQNGLYVVKRFCQYIQKQAAIQTKMADDLKKLADHEIAKKKYDLDESGVDSVKCMGVLFTGHAEIAQNGKIFADKLNSQVCLIIHPSLCPLPPPEDSPFILMLG